MQPIVVKLGGSLIGHSSLREWLRAAADLPVPCVIVPGGGPFADAVRDAQPVMKFGDRAAHTMAILAMEQYGHALLDLEPRLAPLSHTGAFEDGRSGVWLPAQMSVAAETIAASWDVTSDSLAAWLAAKLDAAALILVKAAGAPPRGTTAADWARQNLVDPAFADISAGFRGEIHCLGGDESGRLRKISLHAEVEGAPNG